jgi:hypothetical protein
MKTSNAPVTFPRPPLKNKVKLFDVHLQGLLAEDFHDSASTVNKAIGANPDIGTNPDANWKLSFTEWRDLIVGHKSSRLK